MTGRVAKPAAALPPALAREVDAVLRRFCRVRVPERERRFRGVYFTVRGTTVTLLEERPTFYDPDEWDDIKVAQFRFDPRRVRWSLYCADGSARWQPYPGLGSSESFEALLREVDADPAGIFWA